MIVSPLLAVSFIMKVVAVLFILCSVVLVLVVLIQKGKGGGLSAAFGGGMASGILGSKTGDFLTWVTIALVGLFLSLALVMAKFYRPGIPEFGAGQPAPQNQQVETGPPAGPEQPSPVDLNQTQTSDVDDGADVNSPG